VQKTLNKIYLANERLIKLVNDLLDLSRMESGKLQYEFKNFDFARLIDSIIGEFRIQASDKGIHIVWERADNPVFLWGDQWKLRQVVFNLVDNAIKYTSAGRIEMRLEKEDNNIKLTVSDTGMGISSESIPLIFQKFSRKGKPSKINVQGTGLGLYIAKRIVDDHKGQIWAESSGEGGGSTFYLKLPIKSK